MRIFKTSLLLLLILSFRQVAVNAQPNWKQLPLPNIYTRATPYFLNPDVGFVYDVSGFTQSSLRKTIDGGTTWVAISFFDNNNLFIRQIYFSSFTKGYAATSDGIYESIDGGINWKRIYNDQLPFNSVYAFGNTVFGFGYDSFAFNPWGPLVQSTDDGATWDTIITPTNYTSGVANQLKPYVFGNRDSIVYAEDVISGNLILKFSTNNGKDWSSHALDKLGKTFTMGMTAYAHCKDLVRTFIAPYNPSERDAYLIVHSPNCGATWDTLHKPFEVGAWIAVNSCDQYISDALGTQASPQKKGIWASHDQGKTWVYVNAQNFTEIDDQDFHNLCAVGGGAVIYAGGLPDFTGRDNLWRTTNGGDGSLSFTAPGSQLTTGYNLSSGGIDTLSIQACDIGYAKFFFQNVACDIYAQLQSITIDGLAPSEYTTTLSHHLLCDSLNDTLQIAIRSASTATRDLTVHAHFINDEYYTFDTSFSFTVKIISGPNTSIYEKSLAISGVPGDTIGNLVFVNCTSPLPKLAGIDSAELSFAVNTDLLSPIAFFPSGKGVTSDHFIVSKNSVSVTLHFPSEFTFTGETVIGQLRCKVYLTDTLESDIVLSGNVHATGCQNILSNGSAHFTLTRQCGDSTISKFIQYGSSDIITNIIPNPARNSVMIELRNTNAELHYDLFDELGISRKSGIAATNSFHLDINELPSGNYYLRISNSIGIPTTKKLIISK